MAAKWPRPLGDDGPSMKVYDTKIIARPGEERPDMREYLNAKGEKAFAAVGRIDCFDPAMKGSNATTATVVGNRKTLLTVRHFTKINASDGTLHLLHPSQCIWTPRRTGFGGQYRGEFYSRLSGQAS